MNLSTLDRRKFLRNSTMAGLALATPPFMRGAAVSSSHRFSVTTGASQFNKGASVFYDILLENPYSKIQAIGFDYVNSDTYLVQTMGMQDNGKSEADNLAAGNLVIVKTNLSGTMSSYMYLYNCGHGAGIGVQGNGPSTEPWIWLECDPKVASDGNAYGQQLFRFIWAPNTSLSFGSTTPHTHNLQPGTTVNTPAVDTVYNNLALRYHDASGTIRFAIYDITQIIAGAPYLPWVDFEQPALVTSAGVFQGHALFGEYLYTLSGSSEASTPCSGSESEGSGSPIILTSVNVNNPSDISQGTSNAGYSIGDREPEGMAIYMDTAGTLGSALLCFGIAGHKQGACDQFAASIYYKNS